MIKYISLLSPIYVTLFWSIIFLIHLKEKDKPKKLLGAFMITAFILYCCHAIFFNKLFLLYSYIEFVYVFCMLLIYPVYFIYLEALTNDEITLKEKLQHFIPAAFFGFLVFITSLIMNRENRIIYVEEILINKNLKSIDISTFVGTKGFIFLCSRIAFLFQVIIYIHAGIKLVNRHNKQIEDYYSNTEGKTLSWIKTIIVLILAAATASIAATIMGRGYFSKHESLLIIPSTIFSSLIFLIGFKGTRQISVNSNFNDDKEELPFNETKSGQNNQLKIQLLYLFENEKIYILPDLRITDISEKLYTNRTYVSKLINEEFQMNFNEFVNNYRVQEAKELLKKESPKTFTLEMVAEKSGFGSFNSFTRVFKATTGTTPGKYREHYNLNGSVHF